jgi:hypothetical protein
MKDSTGIQAHSGLSAPDGREWPSEAKKDVTKSTLYTQSRQGVGVSGKDFLRYARGTAMKPDMDLIGALTSFSVGTLDGRDAMMVIELATTPEEYELGIRRQMPVAMTPEHARELGEALLLAARAAEMGEAPSYTFN